jgi:hypothetical protein
MNISWLFCLSLRFVSILLFVESQASQLLTFQKETISTFGDYALGHKLYLGDNSTSLMSEWKALLLSNYYMELNALKMFFMSQNCQRIYYHLVNSYNKVSRWNFILTKCYYSSHMSQVRWLLRLSKKKGYTCSLELFTFWL